MSARRTPSYRRHAPSGQAVVTLNGRDFYLGPHGSQASKAEYDRLLGEWLTNGRVLSHSNANGRAYTVAEIMVASVSRCDLAAECGLRVIIRCCDPSRSSQRRRRAPAHALCCRQRSAALSWPSPLRRRRGFHLRGALLRA